MDVKRRNKMLSGMIAVILSQAISVAVSLIMGFIVPKFIDEYQYSYWQTFLLYYGYVPILNIGLLDGFALRYSKYNYDELDKPRVRSFFRALMLWMAIVGSIICITAAIVAEEEYKIIFILVGIGGLIRYFWAYNYILFQTTERMSLYARYTIFQRVVYCIIIVILLVCRVNSFLWYCLAELIGEFAAGLLSTIHNRGLFIGKGISFKENFQEIKLDVAGGFFLLLANLASNFLIGGARMVIQWRWDALVFGKLSFSFSLTNIFLTFVTAISVVLFPSLKRMKEEELPDLYGKIRNSISPLFFLMLVAYFPLCSILELWLPQYSESLPFLGILLPLTIFASKVSLLTNNYLKAFRKEKIMLVVNLISVAIGMALFCICAYALNNVELLLHCVVFTIMLRSIISEIIVMRFIKRNYIKDFVLELIMTISFMLIVQFLSRWIGCAVYAAVVVVYLLINYKNVIMIVNMIKNILKGKKRQSEENKS